MCTPCARFTTDASQIIEWCVTNVHGDPVRSFELQQRQLVRAPPVGKVACVAGEEAADGHCFTEWMEVCCPPLLMSHPLEQTLQP